MGDGDFIFWILLWVLGVSAFGLCAKMLLARPERRHTPHRYVPRR